MLISPCPRMRGVPESEIRLAGWGDRGCFQQSQNWTYGIIFQLMALRMERVGFDPARYEKKGVDSRRGSSICTQREKKTWRAPAEQRRSGHPRPAFRTVLNNCFRTILLYPVLGEDRTTPSVLFHSPAPLFFCTSRFEAIVFFNWRGEIYQLTSDREKFRGRITRFS
jgi:hypothetical protein